MTKLQMWTMTGLGAVALAIGVFLASGAMTSAQTNTPAATASPGGTFKSNEDPAHEAGESPEREAQEDSGQFSPGHGDGHGHGSNEDPTHEAGESPEREAQENANQAPTSTSSDPGA
jgi:hypothetical protein